MLSHKRKASSDTDRSKKIIKLHPLQNQPASINQSKPPVIPSSSRSLDDLKFKWEGSPWEHYQKQTPLEPGNHLAFDKKYPHPHVFVRTISSAQAKNLRAIVHRNIVQLQRAYIEDGSVSMVYETTYASLKNILSFRPRWGIAETAALCHSVLSALKYIHGSLGVSHGDLRVETIRFDFDGTLKLADIGDSLIRASRSHAEDTRSLVAIIKRVAEIHGMEDSSLRDFLQGLESGQPASTLLKHEFLRKPNGSNQLQHSNPLQHCVMAWMASRLLFPILP